MPRLKAAAQFVRFGLSACSSHPCTRDCVKELASDLVAGKRQIGSRRSPILLTIYNSLESLGTQRERLHSRAGVGWPWERRGKDRVAPQSFAERPRCLSTSAFSSKEIATAEDHESSVVFSDAFIPQPHHQVGEGISDPNDMRNQVPLDGERELSRVSMADVRTSTSNEAQMIGHIQEPMDEAESRLSELEIEDSEWIITEMDHVSFESSEIEVLNVGDQGSESEHDSASEVFEMLRNSDLALELQEMKKPHEDQQGRPYLHVLTVPEIQEILEKARGKDVKVLYVRDSCEWTDHIIIASGRSTRHLRGMADAIVYKVKQRSENVGPNVYPIVEGREAEQWMAVDCGSITVHLFLEEARSYYNLEELWRKKKNPKLIESY